MLGQDKMPILEALINYNGNKFLPFHIPGHLKGHGIDPEVCNFLENIFQYDLTEVPGLDDLHQPEGIIQEAEILAAELFGAQKTFFLVNGTSSGLIASLLSLPERSKVLLPRNSHISLFNGLILADLEPVYLKPVWNDYFMIPTGVTETEYSMQLKKNSDGCALVAINPTYHGIASNLAKIAEMAHAGKFPLVVDEAHGAHFLFSPDLPLDAVGAGADLVVQSTHKVLGSLTQSSMLHYQSSFIEENIIKQNLSIVQSTSPSYLLMLSLDCARRQMALNGRKLMTRAVNLANQTRMAINGIEGLRCLTEFDLPGEFALDRTKLLLNFRGLGLSGYEVKELLRNDYKIEAELADYCNVLCYITYATGEDQCQQLVTALQEIASETKFKNNYQKFNRKKREQEYKITGFLQEILAGCPQAVIRPRTAWKAKKRTVPVKQAVGKISGEYIAPYPPGIPLICPGEEITEPVVEFVRYLTDNNFKVHGLKDQSFRTVSVID